MGKFLTDFPLLCPDEAQPEIAFACFWQDNIQHGCFKDLLAKCLSYNSPWVASSVPLQSNISDLLAI